MPVAFRKDIGKIEEVMEQPGELKVIATLRIFSKNGHAFAELESDQGIPRRTMKKLLRRLSLEI